MSSDSVFMSPSSGRKTSNFFPSGDVNGFQGSTMTVDDRIDGDNKRRFNGENIGEFGGFWIGNKDTELQGPAGGLGVGFLGDLGDLSDLGGELGKGFGGVSDGELGTGSGVGGHMSYIDIGGLSLGSSVGVNGSYSIWTDKPKNGQVFSPFAGHGWSPQVESVGVKEFSSTMYLQNHQTKPSEAVSTSSRQNIYSKRVNNPPFISQATNPEKNVRAVSSNQLVVKLPTVTKKTRRYPKFHDYFLRENNDVNNEDYCSTFYKRNSLGYMFIREPSNTLKVNNSGPRSWVQLKIKFPEATSAKKLKVDIKQLPFWKPINVNIKDPSRAKRIQKDKRKFNVSKRFNKYKDGSSQL